MILRTTGLSHPLPPHQPPLIRESDKEVVADKEVDLKKNQPCPPAPKDIFSSQYVLLLLANFKSKPQPNCSQSMLPDLEQATERTKLVHRVANDRRLSIVQHGEDAQSLIGSYISKDEHALSSSPIGERLPYNDYTTIDWLHDLVR